MARLPESFVPSRETLHRVGAHVLGHRRFDVSGRFGLRSSPRGVATPAFGDGAETLRVAGGTLVREFDGRSRYVAISGSTLRALAEFAGVDLDDGFQCGNDTPPIGDPDAVLSFDPPGAAVIAEWIAFGCSVLDSVAADLHADAQPAIIQLWPEHFDVATDVGDSSGARLNLGASLGDQFEAEPYLYVGPWGPERPGDPAYWNAPFGAVRRWSELQDISDSSVTAQEFMREGLKLFGLS